MNISMINVSCLDSLKRDLMNMANDYGTTLTFEDVLGYRNNVLLNKSLVGEAFKVAKVHAEVSRLKNCYVVRDIASGVVNENHKIVEDNGMRIACDVIKYSEQDIEKIVRSGLEVSGARTALFVGKSNVLITARVWQRIASDVAQDYNARIDFVEIDDFIVGYNLYTEKYPLILLDSFLGDIVSGFLTRLNEVKNVFYVGESEAFYTTDCSNNETALAIYEMIKEQNPDFANHIKGYFDQFLV